MKRAVTLSRFKNIIRLLRYAFIIPLAMLLSSTTVFAEGNDASSVITDILKDLSPAISAMGALVAVVGGIQLGTSFSSENADGKVRGFQTLIGGVIITGVSTAITAANLTVTTTMSDLASLKAAAADYVKIAGSLMTIVGGIQLASSFSSENPDGKIRGFQTLIAGSATTIIASAVRGLDLAIKWQVTGTGMKMLLHIYDYL